MCQCGCSEGSYEAKLPAPDGGWYLFRRYPGCADCETPVGLDLLHVSAGLGEDDRAFSPKVSEIPTLLLHQEGRHRSTSIAFMSPSAFGAFDGDSEEDFDGEELKDAALATFNEYPLRTEESVERGNDEDEG